MQELCETFEANFLHRKKVRSMQPLNGSEWLSELCMYQIIMCGCTRDDHQPAIVHDVAFSASGSAV